MEKQQESPNLNGINGKQQKTITVNWATKLKLNYPRTLLIGLAFFSISLFWQVYEYDIPLILGEYISGENKNFIINIIMMLDNLLALIMLPLIGILSDKTNTRFGKRMPYIVLGTAGAVVSFVLVGIGNVIGNFPMIITSIVFCLIFMSAFRSPAVALMPDLTPKPLRSKANAIINITGTIGGIIATMVLLPMLVSDNKTWNDVTKQFVIDYSGTSIWLFISVGLIMFLSAVGVFFAIKENKVKEAVKQKALEMGYDEEKEEAKETEKTQNSDSFSRNKKISLILILVAVFLWFMGYNAVTTAASRYGYLVWQKPANMALTIAQGAAFLLAIPAGLLGSKIGRKWTIIIGVGILTVAFALLTLITASTNLIFAYILFAMVGIGWATINVNSFPMVVELSKGSTLGKYTGYYYFFSMAAQTVTPLISGLLLDINMKYLFPYAAVFAALALIPMFFVKMGSGNVSTVTKEEILEQMESKR